ncbi:hypothetical protein F7725_016860 [Dissostichus mawsoni]|uniref:Uncharacterized protein n=1 Tax=Dissostichus mawsoni TaxID=36200 RepID=A0A7J5Z5S2_DISMA|nr:hypothetical protein F7725_016860 [Dissostichus mawsoni]
MENSGQTTLRLRALARGPVWIWQSLLRGSALRESGRQMREEQKTNVVITILATDGFDGTNIQPSEDL